MPAYSVEEEVDLGVGLVGGGVEAVFDLEDEGVGQKLQYFGRGGRESGDEEVEADEGFGLALKED